MENGQGTADLVALETSLKVVSLPEPLHFSAEADRSARWRPLCPEAPDVAGLTDRSPEGIEERWAPYDEVYTTLPQRGLPSGVLSHGHQNFLAEVSY